MKPNGAKAADGGVDGVQDEDERVWDVHVRGRRVKRCFPEQREHSSLETGSLGGPSEGSPEPAGGKNRLLAISGNVCGSGRIITA